MGSLVAHMRDMRITFLSENLKGGDHSKDLGIDNTRMDLREIG